MYHVLETCDLFADFCSHTYVVGNVANSDIYSSFKSTEFTYLISITLFYNDVLPQENLYK